MKHISDKDQERYLNELYADAYYEQEAIDNFSYFNDGKIRASTISNAYHNHTLGTLLRKYDPIAFEISKQDRN